MKCFVAVLACETNTFSQITSMSTVGAVLREVIMFFGSVAGPERSPESLPGGSAVSMTA